MYLNTIKGKDLINVYNSIPCYDFRDEIINYFTQWDVNQTITIKDLNVKSAPIFHFYTQESTEAISVRSKLSGGNLIVDVPNILLQKAQILYMCVFIEEGFAGKTSYVFQFSVRKKPKPSEYLYTDNIRDFVASATVLLEELQEAIKMGSSFVIRGRLYGTDDLNKLFDLGTYWTAAADSPANMPDQYKTRACNVIVFRTDASESQRRLIQIITPSGSTGAIVYRVYHINTDWGEWVQLATSDDVDKALGNDDGSAWKPLPLVSGVSNGTYGRDTSPVYRKIGNEVIISGTVACTMDDSTTTIANLPTGYRPKSICEFALKACTGSRLARVKVTSAGVMSIDWIINLTNGTNHTGEVNWLDIGIRYYVD